MYYIYVLWVLDVHTYAGCTCMNLVFSVLSAAPLLQCVGGFGTSDYKCTFQQKEFRSDSVQASEKSSKELTGFTREPTHDPISSRPLEAFTWDSQTRVGKGCCLCVGGGRACECCVWVYVRTFVCVCPLTAYIHMYLYHVHTVPICCMHIVWGDCYTLMFICVHM